MEITIDLECRLKATTQKTSHEKECPNGQIEEAAQNQEESASIHGCPHNNGQKKRCGERIIIRYGMDGIISLRRRC